MIRSYLVKLIETAANRNHENISVLLGKKNNATFLDLGCDDGEVTKKISQKLRAKKIYGVDIEPLKLKLAMGRGIIAVKADLNKRLPFKNNTFDVIHSNQVIEHLYNTDMFVSEIYRILKKDGYAVISTENLSSWHNIFALVLGLQPFSMTNFSIKGIIGNPFALWNNTHTDNSGYVSWNHMRLFSYFGLKDLFEKHGFLVKKIKTAGYYPFWGKLADIDPMHGHWIAIKVVKR